MSLKCIVFDCNPVPQHHAVARMCLCLRYFHCSLISVFTSFFSRLMYCRQNVFFSIIIICSTASCGSTHMLVFYFISLYLNVAIPTRLDVRTPELDPISIYY